MRKETLDYISSISAESIKDGIIYEWSNTVRPEKEGSLGTGEPEKEQFIRIRVLASGS